MLRPLLLVFFISNCLTGAGQLHAQSLATFCASPQSDPDGDGWGWENNQSCIVDTTGDDTQHSTSNNTCPDPDGDGWGWFNGQSCRVAAEPDTTAVAPTGNCVDPDGDGWGWRNGQSCRNDQKLVNTSESAKTIWLNKQPDPGPYPQRDPFKIKSINTDHWPQRSVFTNANTGGVGINLVWSFWQPVKTTSACSSNQIRYDNHCFTIPHVFDEEVRYWSSKGLNVTGILWGVPDWARTDNCYTGSPARDIFCTATDPQDFARFAGMLARRYNGSGGHGQVHDFVIHNEVNMNDWYDHECGQGTPCNQQRWIDRYSADFNAAYDAIKLELPQAKVFIPFAHQYAESFNQPAQARPVLSVKTFIRGVHANAGGRQWQIAYHPYSKSLGIADFSIDDLPYVTFGNIGILASWLRREFPNQPASWEIYLTESGFNSIPPVASEDAQANALCKSFRNALATPGIENYIYHRMQDHPAELAAKVGLGLHDTNGRAKKGWQIWSTSSGRNGQRKNLDCGFEHLPYTRVASYTHPARLNRTSSRVVDAGYRETDAWYLHRNHVDNAVIVYECQQGDGSYLSARVSCDGNNGLGPVGYAYLNPIDSTVLLQTCKNNKGLYTSVQPDCGSDELKEIIGYAKTRK